MCILVCFPDRYGGDREEGQSVCDGIDVLGGRVTEREENVSW